MVAFQLGSVPGMVNKDVFAQLICLHNLSKNCLPSKISKLLRSVYIEKTGWAKAEIL